MDLVSYFKRTMGYDAWANREICRTLGSITPPPEKAVSLFAHVIGAEWTWLGRMQHDVKKAVVWPPISLTECRKELGELHEAWDQFFEGLDEGVLARTFSYTNSKGEAFESSVADALTHVVAHSSYHRGQINAALRAAGHEPAYVDFIHAARHGHLD